MEARHPFGRVASKAVLAAQQDDIGVSLCRAGFSDGIIRPC